MPRISRLAKPEPAAPRRPTHAHPFDVPDPAAADDDTDDAHVVHKLTSTAEAGVQRPPGVAASAFDAGRIAAVGWTHKPKRRLRELDLDAVTVEHGVPQPIGKRDQVTRSYLDLIGRMNVGDSVLLGLAQGRRLYNVARRLGCTTRTNLAEPGKLRVWLTSKPDAAAAPKAAGKKAAS